MYFVENRETDLCRNISPVPEYYWTCIDVVIDALCDLQFDPVVCEWLHVHVSISC